jgi:predicted nucleic acid-binding protein
LAGDITKLARQLAPRRLDQRDIEVQLSQERRGRIVTTGQVINGKRLVVQRRRAFSIHVGEQPAKKPSPNN